MNPEQPLLEYVLASLAQARGRWPQVATESGVPYHTLTKIAQRKTENPGVNQVQKLADYFRAQEAPLAR